MGSDLVLFFIDLALDKFKGYFQPVDATPKFAAVNFMNALNTNIN